VYDERFVSRYPAWRGVVERTLFAFLDCGIEEHGFARVRCDACRHGNVLQPGVANGHGAAGVVGQMVTTSIVETTSAVVALSRSGNTVPVVRLSSMVTRFSSPITMLSWFGTPSARIPSSEKG